MLATTSAMAVSGSNAVVPSAIKARDMASTTPSTASHLMWGGSGGTRVQMSAHNHSTRIWSSHTPPVQTQAHRFRAHRCAPDDVSAQQVPLQQSAVHEREQEQQRGKGARHKRHETGDVTAKEVGRSWSCRKGGIVVHEHPPPP